MTLDKGQMLALFIVAGVKVFVLDNHRRSLIRSVAAISCVKVRSSETSCQIRRSNVMEQQSRAQICPAIDGLYGDASPVMRHYRMLIFFPGLIRHARHHFLQEIAYGDMVRLVSKEKPVIPRLYSSLSVNSDVLHHLRR